MGSAILPCQVLSNPEWLISEYVPSWWNNKAAFSKQLPEHTLYHVFVKQKISIELLLRKVCRQIIERMKVNFGSYIPWTRGISLPLNVCFTVFNSINKSAIISTFYYIGESYFDNITLNKHKLKYHKNVFFIGAKQTANWQTKSKKSLYYI